MEGFNKKEKNLNPIFAASEILKKIGISQLADAELSGNDKKLKESENKVIGRKHRGGSKSSEVKKLEKSSGPDKDDLGDDELPEGHTNPYDGE